MPKLFLVGITPDHRGLVLSDHARAKRGDMVLEIDDRLLEAIDKANRLRTRDEGVRLESNALPSRRGHGSDDNGAVTRLSPREIQQRLRAGESVAALAKSSGTDEAWIRRFAAPVLAEQAKVVERARSVTYHKRGVGLSAASLVQAVAANVIDRGVPLTLPDLEAGWSAYQHPEGGWRVTFTIPLRGRRQTAEWEIDLATGDLAARNKLATELGWRESAKKLPQPKPVKAPAAKRPPAAKARPAKAEDTAPTAPAETDVAPGDGPPAQAPPTEAPQTLPLSDETDKTQVFGLVRRVSRPPKRAAAAKVESPAETVVPVPEGSMPPTDLDVVDVVVDLRPLDDEAVREPAPLGAPPAPRGGPPAP
ncbi:MAG: DUF3071 domain-containing protein [Actinobacteria bacterium]|nr:DUF3071 domain-containing protein [Actinomycetota bacterium]